jgi:hypothetical protein
VKQFHSQPREHKHPGVCQEPGCHLLAVHCERHCPYTQEFPTTRAAIEDVIRELEFESPVRWAPVIEKLRGVL